MNKNITVKRVRKQNEGYLVSTDHIEENYDIVGQDEDGIILVTPKSLFKKLIIKKESK